MDKDRAATIAAIAVRGEEIKRNSGEFLWFFCCGIKPPPLPDKPVVTHTNVDPQLQRRPLHRATPATKPRP